MIINNKVHTAVDVTDNYNDIKAYGPSLEYIKYNQEYMELMNEIAQRKSGVYGIDEFDPASFDQAWTVTGKTNDDEDRATVKNITGNGNDLVLSNFAFAGDSGYGLYTQNYLQKWVNNESRVICTKTSDMYNITSIKGVQVHIYYQSIGSEAPFTVPSYKVKITGLTDNQSITYANSGATITTINSDGVYELPSFEFAAAGAYYGFIFSKPQESCDITIEQIPDYEGYLVTDGVNDKIQSSSFELDKDWTIIGDWMLFKTPKYIGAGIIKPQNIYVYNTSVGLQFFVNTTQLSFSISGIKSVNAICSDGRIYTNDWSEIINDKVGTVTSSNNSLIMGFNSSNTSFTKMAFKNLAVYDGKVLTKDQCIKAYNYLQTLKEK